MLNDSQIHEALQTGDITVQPDAGVAFRVQPASLDIRLSSTFLTIDRRACPLIDPKTDTSAHWDRHEVDTGEAFALQPGQFALGATLESIRLCDTIVARVEGRSSVGRLGILVHVTAGFIDPGWALAPITLELLNVAEVPVLLWPGMRIGQLAFERIDPASKPYTGKYVGSDGPVPSGIHRDWMGNVWS